MSLRMPEGFCVASNGRIVRKMMRCRKYFSAYAVFGFLSLLALWLVFVWVRIISFMVRSVLG